jgi:hypothetical protein
MVRWKSPMPAWVAQLFRIRAHHKVDFNEKVDNGRIANIEENDEHTHVLNSILIELRELKINLSKSKFNRNENQNWRKLENRISWISFILSMFILLVVVASVMTSIKIY